MKYQEPVGGQPDDSYINGNPVTGVEGSIPPAAAIEQPMREIVNAITAAGLTPDDGDLTQLYQALGRMAGRNVTMLNAADSPAALTIADAGLVVIDASGGDVDMTIPAADSNDGLSFTFARIDSGAATATVTPGVGDTIEGSANMAVGAQNRRNIVADGVDTWYRITPLGVTIQDIETTSDYELVMKNGILMTKEV